MIRSIAALPARREQQVGPGFSRLRPAALVLLAVGVSVHALLSCGDAPAAAPGAREKLPRWSKPVKGLRWRVWLESSRIEQGQPIVAVIEFHNASDKPIRLYKDVTVGKGLYPTLYTSDGGKDLYPIEPYHQRSVRLDETVLLGPDRTHRARWSRMSTMYRPAGPAMITFSYSSPKNTNPKVTGFWSGLLGGMTCKFTIVPATAEIVARRLADTKARLAKLWELVEAHRRKSGKFPEDIRAFLGEKGSGLLVCPMTNRTYGYNRKRKGGEPLVRSGEWTRGRSVERIELDTAGRITVRLIRTLPEPPKPKPRPNLDEAAMRKLWEQMGVEDQDKAYGAVRALVAGRDKAAAFLTARLRPVTATREQIAKWIADLDSDKYARRKGATEALSALGRAVEAALRQALKKAPGEEARSRLRALLDSCEQPFPAGPDAWRITRGVRALEWIGTDTARRALGDLAKGAKGARQTELARSASKRIAAAPSGLGVKKFGVNRGTPIYDGFIFRDGKYIEAPYVVERWGLDIYINGILFSRGMKPAGALGSKVRDDAKARYERMVKSGGVRFYKSRGGSMSMSRGTGVQLLRALLANGDELGRKNVKGMEKVGEFVGNLQPMPQLLWRLGIRRHDKAD